MQWLGRFAVRKPVVDPSFRLVPAALSAAWRPTFPPAAAARALAAAVSDGLSWHRVLQCRAGSAATANAAYPEQRHLLFRNRRAAPFRSAWPGPPQAFSPRIAQAAPPWSSPCPLYRCRGAPLLPCWVAAVRPNCRG